MMAEAAVKIDRVALMKTRRWCVGLLIAIAVFAVICLTVLKFRNVMVGPTHEWVLANTPEFLSEQLALEKANELLELDGLTLSEWTPYPDERTIAPNGQRDRFLVRNTLNHNQGAIRYHKQGAGDRFANVELVGNRLVCQLSRGK
jgi:hypothetical protein